MNEADYEEKNMFGFNFWSYFNPKYSGFGDDANGIIDNKTLRFLRLLSIGFRINQDRGRKSLLKRITGFR